MLSRMRNQGVERDYHDMGRRFGLLLVEFINGVPLCQLEHHTTDPVILRFENNLSVVGNRASLRYAGSKGRGFLEDSSDFRAFYPVNIAGPGAFNQAGKIFLVERESLVAAGASRQHGEILRVRLIEQNARRHVLPRIGGAVAVDTTHDETVIRVGIKVFHFLSTISRAGRRGQIT